MDLADLKLNKYANMNNKINKNCNILEGLK